MGIAVVFNLSIFLGIMILGLILNIFLNKKINIKKLFISNILALIGSLAIFYILYYFSYKYHIMDSLHILPFISSLSFILFAIGIYYKKFIWSFLILVLIIALWFFNIVNKKQHDFYVNVNSTNKIIRKDNKVINNYLALIQNRSEDTINIKIKLLNSNAEIKPNTFVINGNEKKKINFSVTDEYNKTIKTKNINFIFSNNSKVKNRRSIFRMNW